MRTRLFILMIMLFIIYILFNIDLKISNNQCKTVRLETNISLNQNLINKGDLNVFSEEYDRKLGLERCLDAKFDLPLIKDENINKYIDNLALEVRKNTTSDFDFKIYVVNQESIINAFSFPAGYTFIYRGLIETTDNEDELFGILAHEWAHTICRHISEARSREILQIYEDPFDNQIIEREADIMAAKILIFANRDPYSIVRNLFRIHNMPFIDIGGGNPRPNLFGRIINLLEFLSTKDKFSKNKDEVGYKDMIARLKGIKPISRFVTIESFLDMDINQHPDIKVQKILKLKPKKKTRKPKVARK